MVNSVSSKAITKGDGRNRLNISSMVRVNDILGRFGRCRMPPGGYYVPLRLPLEGEIVVVLFFEVFRGFKGFHRRNRWHITFSL